MEALSVDSRGFRWKKFLPLGRAVECGVRKYSRHHLIMIISMVMFDLIRRACGNQQLNRRVART